MIAGRKNKNKKQLQVMVPLKQNNALGVFIFSSLGSKHDIGVQSYTLVMIGS